MEGSALLADISGFTPLTEALVGSLGPHRGAEELTKLVNGIYTDLVSRVRHFGGSVVCFIGDALIACYAEDRGLRALACALQMQRAMKRFRAFPAPHGGRVSLAMKAAVTVGSMRRFLIGDPEYRQVDVLAGETVDRLSEAEHMAERGEVVASPEVARRLSADLLVSEWRGAFGVVEGLRGSVEPEPWPKPPESLTPETLRPYLHDPVHERVLSGEGDFLAELRPVSVLFLQFAGIDYDADDEAGAKLDGYTRWVQGVAGRYGGYVLLVTTADKGSHLYVVFGALEAHEDDRQRAVATALRLLEPPAEFGFIIGARIGVSVGRARVGAYGGENRKTYGALGEAVNLAARLMQAAPAGEIRCSEAIYHAAKDRWRFDELPAIQLKGMEQPQRVYRPHSREKARDVAEERGLIGRRSELSAARRALRGARDGTRHGLLLEGEAGIGKSRLTEEIRRIAIGDAFTCLVGEADAIEQHTPYRVWQTILLRLLGIDEAGEPAERRERVIERVKAMDSSYVERAPLLNDILGLGIPETALTSGYAPGVRQGSLVAFVGELLALQAAEGPLALIVEDAHWLDSLSWDLLVSVCRSLANHPAFILLTHRPVSDPIPGELGTLQGMAGFERLPLGSLSLEETVELVALQIGLTSDALPRPVVELLGDRAEGNPFFAKELVGALLDRGLIKTDGGMCIVGVDESALRGSVPDTLEGVVLARLDQLSTEEQLTIKVASVIGRSFLLRTLVEVHPGDSRPEGLRAQLARISGRGLTMLETEDPEPSYAFQHAVTQDVAYDTLLYEQRRGLHRAVAAWYEAAHAGMLEPHFPLLAFHWNRAEHLEKECTYSRLAGEQAADRYANAEAEIYLSRALELIGQLAQLDSEDSERKVGILRQRARVLGLLGRVEEERNDLEHLLGWCDASREAACHGEVLLLWSGFHRRCGSFEEAKRDAERALEASREAGSAGGEAEALTHIGSALEGLGEFQQARESVESAFRAFQAADDRVGQATSLKTLGVVSARLGELPVAMERFNEARALYREIGDRKGEADILGNLGALNYYLGDYETCIEYTEQAQPLFQEMGNRIGSAKCLTNLGNSYAALGAFEEALACHQQALEVYEQLEDASGRADSLCNVGLAHHALGVGGQPGVTACIHEENRDLRAALDAAEQALELYREIGNQRGEMISEFNLGTAYLCIGNAETGTTNIERSLDLSRTMEIEPSVRWALSAAARAKLFVGDIENANRLSTEAIDLLGDQSSPEGVELRFTHFQVLTAIGHADEAMEHLEAARSAVIEQAGVIRDAARRDQFLKTYREILTAWEKHQAAPKN